MGLGFTGLEFCVQGAQSGPEQNKRVLGVLQKGYPVRCKSKPETKPKLQPAISFPLEPTKFMPKYPLIPTSRCLI